MVLCEPIRQQEIIYPVLVIRRTVISDTLEGHVLLIPTNKPFSVFFQQIFLKVTALILLIWSLVQSVFSASLPESEEETWGESQPWLRSHNEPHHQHQRHGWFWRKKPRTTPSITEQPPPATTTKPPGPEICRNRTIVTRVQDEPGPILCLRKNITELMTVGVRCRWIYQTIHPYTGD